MPILDRSIGDSDKIEIKIGGNVKAQNAQQLLNYGNVGKPQPLRGSYDFTKKELTRRTTFGADPSLRTFDRIAQTKEINHVDSASKFQGSTLIELEKKNIIGKFEPIENPVYKLGGTTRLSTNEIFDVNPWLLGTTIYTGKHLQIPFERNNVGEIIVKVNDKVQNDFNNTGSKLLSLKKFGILK